MTAIGLIFGELTAAHYEDDIAADPRIDLLRGRMAAREEPMYSRDYLHAELRSIANAVQVFFRDGTCTERVEVHYPIGHKRRRGEGIPRLIEKFTNNLLTRFSPTKVTELRELCLDSERLESTPVEAFMGMLAVA